MSAVEFTSLFGVSDAEVSEITSLVDASETGVLEPTSLFGVSETEVSEITSLLDTSETGSVELSSLFAMLNFQKPFTVRYLNFCLMNFPQFLGVPETEVSEITSLFDTSETGVLELASLFGVSETDVSRLPHCWMLQKKLER